MDCQSITSPIKTVFILIDGIGDLSQPDLLNLTPLQTISLPSYDLIATSGLTGLMDPVETGLACGSDTAHMNIFGYNPFQEYRGRGSFETLGSGIPMNLNEIGFKCNFAYMDPKTRIVEKRRVDREFHKWGIPLIKSIDGLDVPGFPGYKCACVHATEHRCAIKITGPSLSCRITSTDPLKDGIKLKEVVAKIEDTKFEKNMDLKKETIKNETNEKALLTAKIVNSLSDAIFDILSNHPLNKARVEQGLLPANIILLRGCGSRLTVKSFQETHGFNGFMIAPTAIINGLGQSIYMDIIKVPGATGDYDSDYYAKSDALIENIRKECYDFGFLHIKAVDDAGHDKSLKLKIEYYKRVDSMMSRLINGLKATNKEYIICLTGDHTTPIKSGDHTFEPVPFAISSLGGILGKKGGLENLRDRVQKFDEISCAEGCLGRFSGAEVMGIVKRMREVIRFLKL